MSRSPMETMLAGALGLARAAMDGVARCACAARRVAPRMGATTQVAGFGDRHAGRCTTLLSGGCGGARTHALLLKRQVLYLLSYTPVGTPGTD